MKLACEFCDKPLNPADKGICQWTSGWVKNRSGGGGHAVHLPERLPRFAHYHCVERVAQGYDKRQTSLLDGGLSLPDSESHEPPPTNAGFADGLLVHVCNVCGGTAPYGVGVALNKGDLGLWYCHAHRPWCEVA